MAAKNANLENMIAASNPNVVSVEEFSNRIKAELTASTAAWLKISAILKEANDQYGFSSDKMKELIAEIGFTASKANKLVRISKSTRLEAHADKFSTLSAWTVLYHLTTLADDEFAKVVESYKPEVVVSVAWINEVLGKEKPKPTNHKPLFSVQVNFNALKASEFGNSEFEKVEEALGKLKEAVPYIEIVSNGLFEKECEQGQRELENAWKVALKKQIGRAISEYKDRTLAWQEYRNPKLRKARNLKRPQIADHDVDSDLYDLALEDAEKAFDTLEADWFTQQDLMNEALEIVAKKQAKYAERLKNE